MAEEVKTFARSIGIVPTDALRRAADDADAPSIVWFWLQRAGTIAVRRPVDVRLAIALSGPPQARRLEQVYRVDRYSVYYRQGNEFADARSRATSAFAREGLLRRVVVVLHEDLHGDANFDLPWEIEEAVVTPLAALAAVEFFRSLGDEVNARRAVAAVEEDRRLSRELNLLAAEVVRGVQEDDPERVKTRLLGLVEALPVYRVRFWRELRDQHAETAVEAKLSHDLAYYLYYDRIAGLYRETESLKELIAGLKELPRDAGYEQLERHLDALAAAYRARAARRAG